MSEYEFSLPCIFPYKDRIFNAESLIIYLFFIPLLKIFQNMGFLWPAFSHIRKEFLILSLCGKIRVRNTVINLGSMFPSHRFPTTNLQLKSINWLLLDGNIDLKCFHQPCFHKLSYVYLIVKLQTLPN